MALQYVIFKCELGACKRKFMRQASPDALRLKKSIASKCLQFGFQWPRPFVYALLICPPIVMWHPWKGTYSTVNLNIIFFLIRIIIESEKPIFYNLNYFKS